MGLVDKLHEVSGKGNEIPLSDKDFTTPYFPIQESTQQQLEDKMLFKKKQKNSIDQKKRALFKRFKKVGKDSIENIQEGITNSQEKSSPQITTSRRDFIKAIGVGGIGLAFLKDLTFPKLGWTSSKAERLKREFAKSPPMIKELSSRYDLNDKDMELSLNFWRLYCKVYLEGQQKLDPGPQLCVDRILDRHKKRHDSISQKFREQEPFYSIMVELYNEHLDRSGGYEYIGVEEYAKPGTYMHYFGKATRGLVRVTRPKNGINDATLGTQEEYKEIEENLYRCIFKVTYPNNEEFITSKFMESTFSEKEITIKEIQKMILLGKNEIGEKLPSIQKTHLAYSFFELNTLYAVVSVSGNKQKEKEAINKFNLTYPLLEKKLAKSSKVIPNIRGKPYCLNPKFWF